MSPLLNTETASVVQLTQEHPYSSGEGLSQAYLEMRVTELGTLSVQSSCFTTELQPHPSILFGEKLQNYKRLHGDQMALLAPEIFQAPGSLHGQQHPTVLQH